MLLILVLVTTMLYLAGACLAGGLASLLLDPYGHLNYSPFGRGLRVLGFAVAWPVLFVYILYLLLWDRWHSR